MEIDKYVHDKPYVLSKLKTLPKGGIVCLSEARVHIPSRFFQHDMATMVENYVETIAAFALIVDNRYLTLQACSKVKLEPTYIQQIKHNDIEYYELVFAAGSPIYSSNEVFKDDVVTYQLFDEFIYKANVPWYIDDVYLATIFQTADSLAGAPVGALQETMELLVSRGTRNPEKLTQQYRYLFIDPKEARKVKPTNIAIKDVMLSVDGSINKIAGSYPQDGIASILINPSKEVNRIEQVVRQGV